MLLLPGDFLIHLHSLLSEQAGTISTPDLEQLYARLAAAAHVTHIALNKPIPPRNQNAAPSTDSSSPHGRANGFENAAEETNRENILRSPHSFTPVYGDFGPSTCDRAADGEANPSAADFDSAFWALARQNAIWQVWAPRWTMFSRGNISEKARILSLESVVSAVQQGKDDGRGCAAVDLFVGVGYFAFSYLRAGVSKVVGWDLNPWSVEGLRRGAKKNRWSVKVCGWADENGVTPSSADNMLPADGIEEDPDDATRLIVFNENNDLAPARIERLRERLPPIRHVNCGMLPSSRASLAIAAAVLDPVMGGWVHIHENFLESEIELKAEETRAEFETQLQSRRKASCGHPDGLTTLVTIEYINRLKNYAPHVMHCVIDLYIPPLDGPD